ncbi:hypothetical protein, partial [Mesorhizobium sp. LSJC269B00]|uniref:hypothetical protein n=1 Tax=Mesorhizobium sp. LSJC269B00 TaxID=1287326 RepID=UPI001AEC507E
SSLCAKPHDQHHGRPILQNLTHTTTGALGAFWMGSVPMIPVSGQKGQNERCSADGRASCS